MRKAQALKRLESLDAEKDHLEIVRFVTYHDFHWDMARSLEFALFRTFAIPTIGELLHATRKFEEKPQKRYDDTDLILSEILENGYDSPNGKNFLKKLNDIHHQFNISNDDMLYVLCTFVFEPVKWNLRFGYRKTTEKERMASYFFWKEMGKRMGIKNIPGSYEQLGKMYDECEKTRFKYSEGGLKVAESTINLLLGWYLPKWTWNFARPFLYVLMDDRLRNTFCYPKPNIVARGIVIGAMRFRAFVMGFWPIPTTPVLRTKRRIKSYPNGYAIDELGSQPPEDMEEKWRRKSDRLNAKGELSASSFEKGATKGQTSGLDK